MVQNHKRLDLEAKYEFQNCPRLSDFPQTEVSNRARTDGETQATL